ncbi:MAG: lipoyl(octanoyl) transferase LipB [Flavobacteriaceae bacterium]
MNKVPNKVVKVVDLGRKPYKPTWDLQEAQLKAIVEKKRDNRSKNQSLPTSNFFYWVEHPPVITLGKSGFPKHLLLNAEELKDKGIEFFTTNRGGDITFHGPGQLVGYPVLDLENFFTDIHKYLRSLEEVIILTLNEFNIRATRSEGETGVWLDVGTPYARKICAMGVKASRWVTMHGFALNVNTDLSYFDYIIPCGIQGKAVTSMEKECQTKIPLEQVKIKIQEHFSAVFQAEIVLT